MAFKIKVADQGFTFSFMQNEGGKKCIRYYYYTQVPPRVLFLFRLHMYIMPHDIDDGILFYAYVYILTLYPLEPMPSELTCVERPDGLAANNKSQDNHVIDLLEAECSTEDDDGDDDDDLEDDYDEELEYAYQCDFQKKRPNKPCSTNSLLTNLLSSSSTVAKTEQCNSFSSMPTRSSNGQQASMLAPPISINSTTAAAAPAGGAGSTTSDPLSESLKQNLEWEHCQHSLKKYQRNRRASNNDVSWTDNFSKW